MVGIFPSIWRRCTGPPPFSGRYKKRRENKKKITFFLVVVVVLAWHCCAENIVCATMGSAGAAPYCLVHTVWKGGGLLLIPPVVPQKTKRKKALDHHNNNNNNNPKKAQKRKRTGGRAAIRIFAPVFFFKVKFKKISFVFCLFVLFFSWKIQEPETFFVWKRRTIELHSIEARSQK